ncbi:MAG: hypothetical protein PHX21_10275 [bacterium]|nr:hypothetical protein [bacterium]
MGFIILLAGLLGSIYDYEAPANIDVGLRCNYLYGGMARRELSYIWRHMEAPVNLGVCVQTGGDSGVYVSTGDKASNNSISAVMPEIVMELNFPGRAGGMELSCGFYKTGFTRPTVDIDTVVPQNHGIEIIEGFDVVSIPLSFVAKYYAYNQPPVASVWIGGGPFCAFNVCNPTMDTTYLADTTWIFLHGRFSPMYGITLGACWRQSIVPILSALEKPIETSNLSKLCFTVGFLFDYYTLATGVIEGQNVWGSGRDELYEGLEYNRWDIRAWIGFSYSLLR